MGGTNGSGLVVGDGGRIWVESSEADDTGEGGWGDGAAGIPGWALGAGAAGTSVGAGLEAGVDVAQAESRTLMKNARPKMKKGSDWDFRIANSASIEKTYHVLKLLR